MTLSIELLKKAPARAALDGLIQLLEPAGRLVAVRALRGGLGCSTHAVRIAPRSGRPYAVVLRRYHRDSGHGDPAVACQGEWRTLNLLANSPVIAPRPIWADMEGQLFGQPALVETLLPGHAMLAPADMDLYVLELANALAVIHSVPILGHDWTHATDRHRQLTTKFSGATRESDLEHPDGARVWGAIRALWPQVRSARRNLLHVDYWPGNTLWLRRRLTGVVDWESPGIGDPAFDVSYCRQDLGMLFDLDVADQFLRGYESIVGYHIDALAVWDLIAVALALPDVVRWLPGYHDLGRTDISPAVMRERHRAFIAQALHRA